MGKSYGIGAKPTGFPPLHGRQTAVKHSPSARTSACFWFTLAALFFAACGGKSTTTLITGETQPLQGSAVLTCSTQCQTHGFCGVNPENQKYVLGNLAQPSTGYFDLALPDNTTVAINTFQNQSLQPRMGGDQIPMNFYLVALPDNTKAGWVAGWCVASPSQ